LQLHNVTAATRVESSRLVPCEIEWWPPAMVPMATSRGEATHAGAPTRPVPTSTSVLGIEPTYMTRGGWEELSDKGPDWKKTPKTYVSRPFIVRNHFLVIGASSQRPHDGPFDAGTSGRKERLGNG
jgi:hypothetical protein